MNNVLVNRDIPRTMTLQGLEFLGHLAKTVPENGVIVEVGPLFGSSTWVLAKNAHPSVKVVSIDTWQPQPWIKQVEDKFPGCKPFSKEAFEFYTKDCPNVVPYQGWSPQIMATWDEPIDLFFDDATHGGVGFKQSLDFYLPKLKAGGIAVGDDFASGWPDIVREVTHQGEEWRTRPEVIGRVWAMVKPAAGKAAPSVYSKAGPYGEFDLAISVRMQDGEVVENVCSAWAGKLHQPERIVGVKIDWAKKRKDGLTGVFQTRAAGNDSSNWTPFGGWNEAQAPITSFRGHLVGEGSASASLSYQTCQVVKTKKGQVNRNSKAFRHGQWTKLEEPLQVTGMSAIRCFVTQDAAVDPEQ